MCPSPTRQGGVLWWNKRRTPAVPERGKDNSLYTEYNDSSVLGDKHEAGQEAGKDMSNPATSRHRRRLTFITHINHLHTTNQKHPDTTHPRCLNERIPQPPTPRTLLLRRKSRQRLNPILQPRIVRFQPKSRRKSSTCCLVHVRVRRPR